jgi:hypothetical protein
MKHSYSEEQLRFAISNSTSFRQVLQKLNVIPAGGNYTVLRKRIDYFKIDTSHFTGQLWSKGRILGPKRSLDDYLSNSAPITSHKLRLKLLSEGILLPVCHSCKRKTWLQKPLPLELHHLDGNHKNNQLSNLSLLCPNCHTLTEGYRRRKT